LVQLVQVVQAFFYSENKRLFQLREEARAGCGRDSIRRFFQEPGPLGPPQKRWLASLFCLDRRLDRLDHAREL